MSEPKQEREQRQWWASDDGVVKQVTGYSCAPSVNDYWWCPAIGCSIPESMLYTTKEAATEAAAAECRKNIAMWQERLTALQPAAATDEGGARP